MNNYIWQLAILTIVVSPMLVLLSLGLVWAPAAGAITAWLAHRKGMPVLRAFGGGAIASIFLLLPWFMLTAKQLKWRSADSLTERSYGIVIILWIVFPIAVFSIIGAYFVLLGVALSISFGGDTAFFSIFAGLFGVSGVWMEYVMWNKQRRWVSDLSAEIDMYVPVGVVSLPMTHLAPFAGAWLWSIVAPAYLVSSIYFVFLAS
ncbi:MAG: hypothetical protein OXC55_06880 [Chloroflexi bacterium]|nr:hypothetical protein [Chloroflexota bacterium]